MTEKRLVVIFGHNGHKTDLVTNNIRAADGAEFASRRSGVAFLEHYTQSLLNNILVQQRHLNSLALHIHKTAVIKGRNSKNAVYIKKNSVLDRTLCISYKKNCPLPFLFSDFLKF